MDSRRNHNKIKVRDVRIVNEGLLKGISTYGFWPAALTMCAVLASSCSGEMKPKSVEVDEETLVSQSVDSMLVLTSKNGVMKSSFRSPRMDTYEFAKEPFSEYPKGVEMIGYNDSTGLESTRIVADYALHWTNRDLWELKGNVRAENIEEDRRLFSQQLFYDIKLKKVYSNVDSKVEEGMDVFIGEGFEADDDFRRWTFRKLKGQVGLDVNATEPADEASADSVKKDAVKPPPKEVPAVADPAEAERFNTRPDRAPRQRIKREAVELKELKDEN